MKNSANEVEKGLRFLRKSDPVMRALIKKCEKFSSKVKRDRFQSLVSSIISQQISTAAARSIKKRFVDSLKPKKLSAETLSKLSVEDLRNAGISNQKANYILDLAKKVDSGQVRLSRLGRLGDEDIIEELIQIKGIGRWTAQMFLMFSLGRIDVFAPDDLGLRNAIRNLYELKELPDRETGESIAERWRPYRTIACWYLWRSLENNIG